IIIIIIIIVFQKALEKHSEYYRTLSEMIKMQSPEMNIASRVCKILLTNDKVGGISGIRQCINEGNFGNLLATTLESIAQALQKRANVNKRHRRLRRCQRQRDNDSDSNNIDDNDQLGQVCRTCRFCLTKCQCQLPKICVVPFSAIKPGTTTLKPEFHLLSLFYDQIIPISLDEQLFSACFVKLFAFGILSASRVMFIEPHTIVLKNLDTFVLKHKDIPCTVTSSSSTSQAQKIQLFFFCFVLPCAMLIKPRKDVYEALVSNVNEYMSKDGVSSLIVKRYGMFNPFPDMFVELVNRDRVNSKTHVSSVESFHLPWSYYNLDACANYCVKLWIIVCAHLCTEHVDIAEQLRSVITPMRQIWWPSGTELKEYLNLIKENFSKLYVMLHAIESRMLQTQNDNEKVLLQFTESLNTDIIKSQFL
ncbi:hypothetical protein RFI_30373, partial [Reticulomyxa filosa]